MSDIQNNSTEPTNKTIYLITNLFVIIGIIIYFALAWGTLFYFLYYWFVITVFKNLPIINLYQAIGLAVFANIFKGNFAFIVKSEYRDDTLLGISVFLMPIIIFIVAITTKFLLNVF